MSVLWPFQASPAAQQSLLGNQPPQIATPVPRSLLGTYDPRAQTEKVADAYNSMHGNTWDSIMSMLSPFDLVAHTVANVPAMATRVWEGRPRWLEDSLIAAGIVPLPGAKQVSKEANQVIKQFARARAANPTAAELKLEKRIADPLWSELSTVKMPKPLSEYQFTLAPHAETKKLPMLKPEDLEGGVGVNIPGDWTNAGPRITSVEGMKVDQPLWGGGPYMEKRAAEDVNSIWASGPNAAAPWPAAIDRLTARGIDPDKIFATHSLMGGTAGDFSAQVWNQLPQLARQAKFSKDAEKRFNTYVREQGMLTGGPKGERAIFPDFPGIRSPKLSQWMQDTPATKRKWLVKMLDNAEFKKAGLPDPTAMRLAATNPVTLGMPMGASGMHIGRYDPSRRLYQLDEALRHPDYSHEFPGVPHGSLGTYIPMELMSPDYVASQLKQGARVPDIYQRYNKLAPDLRVQEYTPQWVDTVSPIWEAGGLLTPEGRALAAPYMAINPRVSYGR